MDTHVKVLAVLFIVFSALGVLGALGLAAAFGVAGIASAASHAEDAAFALPIIGITGTLLTVFLLVLSLPGLITGWGLLNFRPWARILGIVFSAILLIAVFPLSTIIGVYGLWVLLNKDSERLFSGPPAAA